jgi:hypothetical protein
VTTEQRSEALEAKRRFWRQHIQSWKRSGLKQAAYCRRHDLKLHCFIYWRKRHRRPDPSPISLVQVQLPPAPTEALAPDRPSPLRLVISSSHCVEIQRDFDPVALRQLLHVLERR